MAELFPILLAEHVNGGWRPGIGDPSPMGWLTVAAYLAAAVACASAARAERRLGHSGVAVHPLIRTPRPEPGGAPAGPRSASRRALFWWLLAAGMLVLGINKQLDLQSILPIVGRQVAQAQGWYEDRRAVQRAFIAGVAVAGVVALAAVSAVFRSVVARRPLAPVGMTFLLLFVLVRASSFHKVDFALGRDLLGIRVNWILELGGIACVLLSAARGIREGRRPPAPRRASSGSPGIA